jgi:tetratricopeptide (TPR) repeat protein
VAVCAGCGAENPAAAASAIERAADLFYVGRAREAVAILDRAKELALASGDTACARACIQWSVALMAWGPTPVSEVCASLERIPPEIERALVLDPANHFAVSHMNAYLGRFEDARMSYARTLDIVTETGGRIHQYGSSMYLGLVELLAGELETAETTLRNGFDALGELGEARFRSTVGALLAETLVRMRRAYEALDLLEDVEPLAAPDDCDPQVRTRFVRALALVQLGAPERGVAPARQAVALAARTDYVVLHGDALVALAQVWQAIGADDEARLALREAIALYEPKQALPQAARAEELLGTLAGR